MGTTVTLPDNLSISQIRETFEAIKPQIEAEIDALVMDGKSVDTVDSTGLQMLVKIKMLCENKNIEYSWTEASDILILNAEKLGLKETLELP